MKLYPPMMFRRIRRIKNEIKWFFQRVFRGFSDDSLFSFDSTVGKFMVPRLIAFKEINFGCPSTLTMEEWEDILDKMIFAFRYSYSNKKYEYPIDQELYASYEEGMELFKTYFHHLWI